MQSNSSSMKSTLVKSTLVATALALRAHAYVDVEEGAFNVRHIHMVERDLDGEIVGRAFGNTYDIVGRDEGSDLEARGRRCTTVMACGTAAGCATMAGQRYCKGESWQKSFQKAVSQTGANGITGLKMMAEGIGRGPAGMIAGMAKSTAKALIDAKKEKKAREKKEKKKGGDKKKAPAKQKGGNKKKGGSKPKGGSKKAAPKKKGPSKPKGGSAKKSGGKKAAPKRAAPKKAASKKSAPKKAAPKKAAPKKAASKKTKRDLEGEDIIEVVNKRDFEVVERDEDMNFVQRSEYSIFGVVAREEDGSIVSRECEMYNGDVSCM